MKRGNTTDLYIFMFSSIFLVVSVMTLMLMNTSYGLEEAYEGIGFRQSALLATYEEVDKYQEHTNHVAKYSVQEALLEYVSKDYAQDCELVGSYPSWSHCFVDVYSNPLLFTTLDEYFGKWWSYPVRQAEYQFSINDNFVGESREKIFFPVLGVKGESVQAVAEVINEESVALSESFNPDSVLVDSVLPDRGFSREGPVENIVINSTRSETLEQEKQRLLNTESAAHYLVSSSVVQMLPEEQGSCSNCDYIRIILVGEQNDRLYELVKDLLDRHDLALEDVLVNIEGFDVGEMNAEVPQKVISESKEKSAVVWPVENFDLESCYGNRVLSSGSDHHDGIDIALPVGRDVASVADGEVIEVCNEWVGECRCSVAEGDCPSSCSERCSDKGRNYGNFVVIKHSESLTSRYSHLDSVNVAEGESVRAGESIAKSGNTGYSFGPHLDLKLYSPAAKWSEAEGGSNPLCFYNDDVIRNIQLTDTANSCRSANGVSDFKEELAACDVSFVVESNRCFSEELQVSLTKENQDKVNLARSRLGEWMPNIETAARNNEIPVSFLLGVITQESVGDPNAISPTGAAGIMQFVAETARSPEGGSLRAVECGGKPYACTRENDDRLNPVKAIPAGAGYLRWILDRPYIGDDLWLAAQAYNSGIGTVKNAVEACEGSVDLRSCVREFIIEDNNEYGSERYDPDYANEVMAHMAAWGGSVSSSTCESLNVKGLGSVEYRPDFSVEVPSVLGEFDELVSWARELNETNDNLHDLDLEHDMDWRVINTFCEEIPANLAVMQLQECQNNNQSDCSCFFDLPLGEYKFKEGFVTDSLGNKINSPDVEMNLSVEKNNFGEKEYSVSFPDSDSDAISYDESFVPSSDSMCLQTMQRQAFCAIREGLEITQELRNPTARFGLVFNDTNPPEQANGASLVPVGSLVAPTALQFSFSKPQADDLSGVLIYCKWPGQEDFVFDRRIPAEFLEDVHSIVIDSCDDEEFVFEEENKYEVAVHSFDFGANENKDHNDCANLASFTVPEEEGWEDAFANTFTGGWYEVYQNADKLRDLASGCSLLGN